jgi:Asp-tRNA(Asn)/Glu-tRNA(Gln) amidotransferase C subunit
VSFSLDGYWLDVGKHEDIENSDNQKTKFLQNSPSSNEDYFLVPRVIE